jgi:hypothetical protein
MRYDGGYGRGYGRDMGGRPPMRGYDYGLRGFYETAPQRPPVRTRVAYDDGMRGGGGGGGYDRGYYGRPAFSNRVTQRYNREYVHPTPARYQTNYNAFGGDQEGRIVDVTGYWRPYNTIGGSRTMRGGGMPIGWEREANYRYDTEFRGYGRDFYGPMR